MLVGNQGIMEYGEDSADNRLLQINGVGTSSIKNNGLMASLNYGNVEFSNEELNSWQPILSN